MVFMKYCLDKVNKDRIKNRVWFREVMQYQVWCNVIGNIEDQLRWNEYILFKGGSYYSYNCLQVGMLVLFFQSI